MFFWTETPETEIWNQIRYLKSTKNVENLLSGKTNSQRQRAIEIASCIRQADEYYQAAEVVGLVTQPLLQFYGAHALAKAVVLSNTSKKLSDINYHGLATRANCVTDVNLQKELQNYSDDPSKWEIEKEFAITNHGLFPTLCESIDETIPNIGVVLSFKELLSRIPDLNIIYGRHYNESSSCTAIGGGAAQNSNVPIIPGNSGGFYLVKPLKSGIYKPFATIFVGLFILSNVVRYKPAFWMQEIEGKISGSASIVENFCNISKRRIPNETLEAIWNEKFEYGVPARMC
jgi:hypothetical protein